MLGHFNAGEDVVPWTGHFLSRKQLGSTKRRIGPSSLLEQGKDSKLNIGSKC